MRIYAVVSLLALAAAGQQPPPRTPAPAPVPQTNIKFTAESNLVIADVTVKDPKTGAPIEGLKASDFAIFEDNKPQKIQVFEFQKLAIDPAPPEPPPTLGSQNELPEDPKTSISIQGPGKIQYHDKRLLVLFFDMSNMAIPDQLRAQEAALKFVDTQMTESDLMAIMMFTTVVQVKTDFTANRSQLKDIINAMPIGDMTDLADAADTADDTGEDTGAAFVADETEFNIFNTDQKLAAIEDVVKKLSALPEKKVLVYVTGGISKTGIDNQAQLEASINAAVKANVAIYPIDARGLMADPPGGGASKASSRGQGIYNGSVYNAQRLAINDSQETLATLAADTGGKVFLDSNDLAAGIVQAQQQFRSYYIIGYYATNTAADGKYRKITVKLNNGLSAKVEARPGYYAQKIWGKFNGSDKELQLQDALSSADPQTDLPLALEIDYFRISPTAYFVPVSVKIPGSVIALAEKKGGGKTQFDFIGNVLDERKSVVGTVRDFIPITVAASEAEKLARRNFHYDAGFTLGPGKYRIRFLVRENQSGKMGTFDYRFVVPDLAADSMVLKTSSVVWSNQREKVQAEVGKAGKFERKVAQANPLIVGEEKIVPNVTRLFRRSQNMYITFDVYDAAPDPKDSQLRHVAVSMSLFNQKGVKSFEAGPIEATQLVATRPNAVPVQMQVPLKGVPPGRYVCQLNVVDQVGRKFAFPRANVVVQ
ncbi:MAG: VWA domain-containing protein [Candidatus Sulfopaludibacter sp.]|nr:VWA domain-containing protein [Candidatus Sulfopaludibacter sp.]